MAPTPDAHTTEAKARDLLDRRIESVRSLVHTRHTLDDLRAKVADAEADDVKAYRAALSDGWSADELKKLGLDEPAKTQRTRRRATTRKSAPAKRPVSEPGQRTADTAAPADQVG